MDDAYDAMMLNGESGNGVRDPLTGESHGIDKRCIGVPGMARQNRIHVTGAIFHVVVRGREDAALLAERQDCERFQSLVQHALVKCRARLCAYCWLPNAAHLVIKLSDVALESVMRQVCGPYSRYLHRQRGRGFRVYQSRYRARVIDADLYLLPLLRYVHAMPVISGLCADPADYPWTSHRAYSGGAQIPWLAQVEVKAALHHRDRNVERAYRTLMTEPLDAWITEQFEHGSRTDSRVAGGAGFADRIERKLAARRASVSDMYCTGETRVAEEVDAALMRAEEKEVHFYRRFAANGFGVATIYAGFLTATMLYAIHQVQAGRMTVGTFVLVTTYMLQIVRPVEQLGYAVQSLSQGLAYLDAMLDVLREKVAGETAAPQHTPPTSQLIRRAVSVGIHHGGSPHPSDVRGDVLFENVSCSYHPDRTVVKNVNLHLSKAKTVGVVGASGSGKSTLGRLLVRLIEPDQGRILLDGVPISELSLQDLRQAVAVVPQDIALFSKTIFYNIAFGRAGSTREEVEAAAKLAQLHDFIMSLPEGYDTKVGQRGLKLSGGEKQRLAIARAAIRRPRVWVLDEATSALDGPAQRQILRNLHEISRSSTALVIAHRLSAIVDADEIVVLEAGVIVERGTHNVLLQQRSRYALLWEAQQHGPAAA